MNPFTLENPVFRLYLVAAAIMIIKMASQAWITVYRMIKVKGGYRSPEDIKRTPINPNPNPAQLELNEYVDRSRRIHLNDTENIPIFLAAGLVFAAVSPPLGLAQVCYIGYVVTRLLHFGAYLTAQIHDVRATFWTFGSLIILTMAGYTLYVAL